MHESPKLRHNAVKLAGAAGFEPANAGTKNRCLTTWRRPSRRARCAGEAALIPTDAEVGRGDGAFAALALSSCDGRNHDPRFPPTSMTQRKSSLPSSLLRPPKPDFRSRSAIFTSGRSAHTVHYHFVRLIRAV